VLPEAIILNSGGLTVLQGERASFVGGACLACGDG